MHFASQEAWLGVGYRVGQVDLDGLWWYQKQAGLWGSFLPWRLRGQSPHPNRSIVADFLSTRMVLAGFSSTRHLAGMVWGERFRMYSRRWLIAAVVACVLASACSQFNTNLSVQTSTSSLTFVSPQTRTAGSSSFTITATGTGFVTGAFILWNGVRRVKVRTPLSSAAPSDGDCSRFDVATPGNRASGCPDSRFGPIGVFQHQCHHNDRGLESRSFYD